jgi:hypothetical protein
MENHDVRLAEFSSRLEKLERENRWLKGIGCLSALLLASMILIGQAKSDRTVEAQSFVLKDASGKVGGSLEMDKVGAKLSLNAANGFPAVILTGSNAPSLRLDGEAASLGLIRGEQQIGLAVNENSTTVGLYGKDTGPYHGILAGLSVINGNPGFSLYDSNGIERVTVDATSHTQGVTLRNAKSRTQAIFGTVDSKPSVVLMDKDENIIWNAP